MKKSTRRLLFYALVLVFLGLSGWLALRAQGFSFDFQVGALRERGALFLRIVPANAAIYLDGERYESSGGVFRSQAFITELAPGAHQVIVVKDGYHRWEKSFIVEALEVVDAATIRLFPRAPTISPIGPISPASPIGGATSTEALLTFERSRRRLPITASSTLATLNLHPIPNTKYQIPNTILYRDLLLSPDEKKVLVRARNELWVIWLKKERLNGIHQPGETEQIASFAENITDALWPPGDSHHVIFASEGRIRAAETDGRGSRNTVDLLEAQDVRFFIDPATKGIMFTAENNLFRLEL